MKGNKLLAAAGAIAGVYGLGIGLAAKAKQPRNMQEARGDGSLSGLGSQVVKDAVITFADDALAIAALPLLKRRFKSMGGIFDTAMGTLAIGGAGVGGTIAGHDFQNFIAARQYRARGGDLDMSQQMVPDQRLNPIQGFNNNGLAGQNRRQQTGIGSPAAGGIFYSMWHNPFADMLNQAIAAPNAQQSEDPRGKALGYAFVGHMLGASLGMSKGIARATALGAIGGIAGGAYGMYTAHNPDLQKNLAAVGEIAIGVAPTMLTAGAIYGLSHGKLGKFGTTMRSGLNKTIAGIGVAGGYAKRGAQHIGTAQVATGRAHMWAAGATERFSKNNPMLDSLSATLTARRNAAGMSGMVDVGSAVDNALKTAVNVSNATTQFGIGAGRKILGGVIGHTMVETAHHTGHWEQSLGLGHLVAFGPHQVMLGMAAANIVHGDSKRGKHSTNTMPSNNRS